MAFSYEGVLARQPLSTQAGDKIAAAEFCSLLTLVLQGQGVDTLVDAQKNYLYKLRAKWQLRADGKDTRWNTTGSKPGRGKKVVKPRREYRMEEADDPLLASLMRKYGLPVREDA